MTHHVLSRLLESRLAWRLGNPGTRDYGETIRAQCLGEKLSALATATTSTLETFTINLIFTVPQGIGVEHAHAHTCTHIHAHKHTLSLYILLERLPIS